MRLLCTTFIFISLLSWGRARASNDSTIVYHYNSIKQDSMRRETVGEIRVIGNKVIYWVQSGLDRTFGYNIVAIDGNLLDFTKPDAWTAEVVRESQQSRFYMQSVGEEKWITLQFKSRSGNEVRIVFIIDRIDVQLK